MTLNIGESQPLPRSVNKWYAVSGMNDMLWKTYEMDTLHEIIVVDLLFTTRGIAAHLAYYMFSLYKYLSVFLVFSHPSVYGVEISF